MNPVILAAVRAGVTARELSLLVPPRPDPRLAAETKALRRQNRRHDMWLLRCHRHGFDPADMTVGQAHILQEEEAAEWAARCRRRGVDPCCASSADWEALQEEIDGEWVPRSGASEAAA